MTTKEHVRFTAWGRWARDNALPAYAVRRDGEDRSCAVARAIARRAGLVVVTLTQDGWEPNGTTHFHATLGTPCRGGGWTPQAEVWFAVIASVRGES